MPSQGTPHGLPQGVAQVVPKQQDARSRIGPTALRHILCHKWEMLSSFKAAYVQSGIVACALGIWHSAQQCLQQKAPVADGLPLRDGCSFWKGFLAVWAGGSVGQALAFLLAR